jgi:anti-sigma B factor antagonist
MSGMTLDIQPTNGGSVFKVAGRLMYEADSHLFQEKLNAELAQGRRWFVVDLSGVIGMSSTGLGVLISSHRRLRDKNVPFMLAHLSEKVRSVLQITRLNTIFEVYDNVDEAVQSAQEAGTT